MIGFFDDSGLSVQSAGITAMQATDGSSAAVDREVFIGVTDTDRAYFAASDPGVDDIMVSIVDAESGTSLLPSSLRMALDAGDLGAATPGAALAIGTDVQPGSVNAVSFWVRTDTAAFAAGVYDNLSLTTNALISQAA
jgi:hypothetical protein